MHCTICMWIPYAGFSQIRSHMFLMYLGLSQAWPELMTTNEQEKEKDRDREPAGGRETVHGVC